MEKDGRKFRSGADKPDQEGRRRQPRNLVGPGPLIDSSSGPLPFRRGLFLAPIKLVLTPSPCLGLLSFLTVLPCLTE